jgi:hypothetical protein
LFLKLLNIIAKSELYPLRRSADKANYGILSGLFAAFTGLPVMFGKMRSIPVGSQQSAVGFRNVSTSRKDVLSTHEPE